MRNFAAALLVGTLAAATAACSSDADKVAMQETAVVPVVAPVTPPPKLETVATTTPEAPPPVAEAPAGERYVVPFDLNSHDILPGARDIIKDVVDAARKGGSMTIVVSGHADRSGTERHNEGLSERRASAVAAALTRAGLSDVIFETHAYGETKPAVDTPDGVEEPRNRRVEIDLGGVGPTASTE